MPTPDLNLIMTPATAAGALGPVTLGALIKEIKDALGKTNLQFEQSPTELVNAWIQKLANLHNWYWRQEYAELGAIAEQAYVALPADFGKLRWVKIKGTTLQMRATTWGDLQERRGSNAVIAGGGYFYATRFGTQSSASDFPRGRLELFPTPAVTEAAAFALSYDRLLPTLSDNDHVPDVPLIHHPLLRQLVRYEALRYDGGDQTQAMLERDEFARMFADHMALDGQIQHEGGGRIQGAVPISGARVGRIPHNSIGF
jgi:hypothetical protein